MTRSRRRKLVREAGKRRAFSRAGIPLASALLAAIPAAYAQEQSAAGGGAAAGGLEEVVVTAQKRTENLQDVPISIQALRHRETRAAEHRQHRRLREVPLRRHDRQGPRPGRHRHRHDAHVHARRRQRSGRQPLRPPSRASAPTSTSSRSRPSTARSTSTSTTSRASRCWKARRARSYGASSEAGTIRIITNKPDPTKFSAATNSAATRWITAAWGRIGEGYVNIPLSPIAAVRLVGWDEHDAGYIHNVAGTNVTAGIVDGVRTFPTSGDSISNAGFVNNQYNTVTTEGGRASVLLKLGDNWTITPHFIGQRQSSNGLFAFDPAVGDLDLVHYGPEGDHDVSRRPRSRSRARSATSTSPMPAAGSSATSTRSRTTATTPTSTTSTLGRDVTG